jgi:hypothetical protein
VTDAVLLGDIHDGANMKEKRRSGLGKLVRQPRSVPVIGVGPVQTPQGQACPKRVIHLTVTPDSKAMKRAHL